MNKRYSFKRIIAVLLISVLLISTVSVSANAEIVTEDIVEELKSVREKIENREYTPIKDNYEVIHIKNYEDFKEFAEKCEQDNYSSGKLFILDNDIDVGRNDFNAIPVFSGIFDGKGHTVSGLRVNREAHSIGLFRTITTEGIVRNLNVRCDLDPELIRLYIGGVCGINFGNIHDCTFDGSLSGLEYVGGICGKNNGVIKGCESNGSIEAKRYSGGIAGCNDGIICECTNHAGVNNVVLEEGEAIIDLSSIDLQAISQTGVGLITVNDNDIVIDIGGITGFSDGIIEECENDGKIGAEHFGYNIGGIVGRQSGVVYKCKNTGEVLGRTSVAGIVGQMEPYLLLSELEDLMEELDDFSGAVGSALEHLRTNANELSSSFSADTLDRGQIDDAFKDIRDVKPDTSLDIDASLGKKKNTATDSQTARERYDEVSGKIRDEGELRLDNLGEEAIQRVLTGEGQYDDYTSIATEGIGALDDVGGLIADRIDEKRKEEEQSKSGYEFNPDIHIKGDDIYDQYSDSVDNAYDAVSENVNKMADGIEQVTDTIGSTTGTLALDLGDVNERYSKVSKLVAKIIAGDMLSYDDISDEGRGEFESGCVLKNENSGKIQGDTDVGGISGTMGMNVDYDLDGVVTSTVESNAIVSRTYQTRCVAIENINRGKVISKKSNAGGIIGNSNLGSIQACQNYGRVESEEGNYVGGICGFSQTVIRDSVARCNLKGKMYIGGIVGLGNKIYDNYAFTDISEGTACVGGIAGWIETVNEELVKGNIFAGGTYGAIDGISFMGLAHRISERAFIYNRSLPEEVRQIEVTFVVDDEEIATVKCEYGEPFPSGKLPAIPEKPGYTGKWDMSGLSDIKRSETVEAVYYLNSGAIRSGMKRSYNGRDIVLVEGDLSYDATVRLTDLEIAPPVISGGTITESWTLNIDGNVEPDGNYVIRYNHPESSFIYKNEVYMHDGEKWIKPVTEQMGSYEAFKATGLKTHFCSVQRFSDILVVAVLAAVILLMLAGILVSKRLGKKKESKAKGTLKKKLSGFKKEKR